MLILITGLYTLYTLARMYISVMQIGYVNQEKKRHPVLMGAGRYRVAGNYAVAKEKLSLASHWVDYLLFVWWITQGFAWLQHFSGTADTVAGGLRFLLGFFAINYLVALPLEWYATFRIDTAFGFNKMTQKMYWLDALKQVMLFVVIGGGVLGGLIGIITHVAYWWLWGFGLVFTVVLGANLLMPYFMRMFYTFRPLESGELRDKIETLMRKPACGLKGCSSWMPERKVPNSTRFSADWADPSGWSFLTP